MRQDRRLTAGYVEIPFEVRPQYSGWRLDAFLAARLHRHSRAKVQGLIEEGRVIWRGRPAKPASRVAAGEAVVILYPAREDEPARHAALPVLYEDDEVLAVNKPGDVLSHPTDKAANNSATAILAGQFPDGKLYLAHRLDRETSGVLLFARSAAAARALQEQFVSGGICKEYWAVLRGELGFERRKVDEPLGYADHEARVRQRVRPEAGASPAVTDFEVLARGRGATLVRAMPKTGRLHQIRAHAAWLGHPVIGDKLYTGEGESYLKASRGELGPADLKVLGAPRQMLHARRLTLLHPTEGKLLAVEAPLSEDFRECLARFGLPIS